VNVYGAGAKLASLSWITSGALAAWAVARIAEADRVHRTENAVVPLLSLTPQAAAAAPWAALALGLTGRHRSAATAAVAAATLGLIVGMRSVPRRQPGASGPVLRLLTANLFVGRADEQIVLDRVRQTGADVLFVQELTTEAANRLKDAGLNDLLPYSRIELQGGPRGSGIYSRFPLAEGPTVPPVRAAQPTALLELPGGESVELICVHPSAPAPPRRGAARFRQELAILPPPGSRPRVLAGDFNATFDHAAFRDVLRLGYVDAARQLGKALTPTWGPPGRAAMFTLDHVLVNQSCAVRAYSVLGLSGSDHRAVFTEIQLPER
jgi:endonuclease/exonuclease/phosphatase family metal-dependent hydrolase